MRYIQTVLALCLTGMLAHLSGAQESAPAKSWAMNATAIEACSCPMFCQCYFNTSPASPSGHDHGNADAGHGEMAYCLFNMGYKVNSGHFGDTKLDGAKFWVAGDLGSDWSQGKTNWAVVHFDPAVTKEQREGILAALTQMFPVKWSSFSIGDDASIEWKADKDRAEARLDGGKRAEILLRRYPGMTDQPIVITNLRYFGAPRNDGFIMMPNEVQTLRVAPKDQKPFEFKGTNGFMITVDIKSDDVKKG